eukprot:6039627-Pleurochrysis_carterae.AAC.3
MRRIPLCHRRVVALLVQRHQQVAAQHRRACLLSVRIDLVQQTHEVAVQLLPGHEAYQCLQWLALRSANRRRRRAQSKDVWRRQAVCVVDDELVRFCEEESWRGRQDTPLRSRREGVQHRSLRTCQLCQQFHGKLVGLLYHCDDELTQPL